jgi:hypothetical protein
MMSVNCAWSFQWGCRLFGMLAGLCLLVHCGDGQDRALQKLPGQGYSLSVAEFLRAAREGNVEALRLLLKAGVDVNVCDASGRCALNEAARHAQLAAVSLLLESGADPQSGAKGSLSAAVEGGETEILRAILRKKPELSVDGTALLTQAAEKGGRQVLATLLAELPSVTAPEVKVLLAAAEKGDTGSMDLLLQGGASAWAAEEGTGRTALMAAAGRGHVAVVELLLNAGSNRFALDAKGLSPLDYAGESEDVCALLTRPLTELEQRFRLSVEGSAPSTRVPLTEVVEHPSESPIALRGAYVPATAGGGGPQQPSLALELQGVYEACLPCVAERMDSSYLILKDGKRVPLGELLPGTSWTLSELRTRSAGPPWWRQEAVLLEHATGRRHLMLPGLPVHCGAWTAELVSSLHGQHYEARAGDCFTLAGSAAEWTVLRILADRVIVTDAAGQSSSIRWPGRGR